MQPAQGTEGSELASALVENVRDYAIFALDTTGRIQSWNLGATQIKGYQASEVIGRHFSIFYTPEDRGRGYPDAELAAAVAMGRYEDEGWRVRSTGERFWANVVITAVRNPAGRLLGFGKVTRDLTERRAAELERARVAARFRAVFDHAPTGLAVISRAGRFLEVNSALCRLTGLEESQILGQFATSLVHPEDASALTEQHARLLAGEDESLSSELRFVHAEGYPLTVLAQTVALKDESQSTGVLVSHVRNITYQRQFEEKLAYLADHDELTGLLNRRRFTAEVQSHVDRCRRYGARGAVLMLDLDNFKHVNDSLGHQAGDALIQAVAELLRHVLRSSDVIARIGGDEFAVLLPQVTVEEAKLVGTKICEALRTAADLHPGHPGRRITVSVGVAMISDSTVTADDLLVDADLNVYEAKEAGRDGVVAWHDSGVERPARARVVWSSRIEAALDADRFALWAQPILNLSSGEVNQYELLVRMLCPTGETVLPESFIGVAERSGLIVDLDCWVVRNAIELVGALTPEARENLVVSVNLSGLSVGHRRVHELIESELQNSGLDPRHLCFEVTETTAVQTLQAAQAFATRLRNLGCAVALDDFGSGFGSFYYLKHLPFDHVKIDGEFVVGCLRNKADRLVVQALISVAHGLGKRTVAEFVEDEPTLEFLRNEGVDLAQGYHIGKPAPFANYLSA